MLKRACIACETDISALRADAKFCSAKCRKRALRAARRRIRPEPSREHDDDQGEEAASVTVPTRRDPLGFVTETVQTEDVFAAHQWADDLWSRCG